MIFSMTLHLPCHFWWPLPCVYGAEKWAKDNVRNLETVGSEPVQRQSSWPLDAETLFLVSGVTQHSITFSRFFFLSPHEKSGPGDSPESV